MGRFVYVGAVVLCAFVLAGCPANQQGATLRVENLSSHTLVELNVVPSESLSWGVNRLPGSMPPNTFYEVEGIATGFYNCRVVSASGASTAQFDVELVEGTSRTWTILDTKDGNTLTSMTFTLTSAGSAPFIEDRTLSVEIGEDSH